MDKPTYRYKGEDDIADQFVLIMAIIVGTLSIMALGFIVGIAV